MNRRGFLAAASALTIVPALPKLGFAADNVINVFLGADSNILDFWNNIVRPAFQKANPGLTVKVTNAATDSGMLAIAERAMAALASKADPHVDLFEAFDAKLPAGGVQAGLWVDFKKANVPLYDHINPMAFQGDYSLPYRGSQVLLAYDSTKLDPKKAPKTWAELVAWIKANPGQFIYNRPDKGGNFVRRAIHEVNGRDPAKFTLDNFTAAYAEQTLTPAWKLLQDLAPSLYEKGAYTSGNTQSIQLLAQGVVTMVPVWSDQVLKAVKEGVLPATTGLVQLTDLALCGDFNRMTIPTNAANKDAAMKLAAFMLTDEMQKAVISEIGGFPGVSWDYLPKDLRDKYADVVPKSIPTFPQGNWSPAVNDGWYRNVAPNLTRG
jgi:putative spermidine/putrescine transport system substrate-binding protein